jgi:hypothetical protein
MANEGARAFQEFTAARTQPHGSGTSH